MYVWGYVPHVRTYNTTAKKIKLSLGALRERERLIVLLVRKP